MPPFDLLTEDVDESRPRAESVLPDQYESIVTNLPHNQCNDRGVPYAEIIYSTLTTSVIAVCLVKLTTTDLCVGCSYTSLLAAVFGFWTGVLVKFACTR